MIFFVELNRTRKRKIFIASLHAFCFLLVDMFTVMYIHVACWVNIFSLFGMTLESRFLLKVGVPSEHPSHLHEKRSENRAYYN